MEKSVSIFKRDSNPYGLSYEEWTQKWWQWILSIPKHKNPLNDVTGENASQNQYGPIFFLAGTSQENPTVVRNIELMKETLLLPVYNELGFDNHPIEIDTKKMSVNINGTLYTETDLRKFKIRTDTFSINVIPDNVFQIQPGGRNVSSDGYWLIVSLTEGTHNIRVNVDKGSFISDVTYYLNIPKTDLSSADYMTMDGHNIKNYVLERVRNNVDKVYLKDIENIITESLKSPEVKRSSYNIAAFDTVSKNIDEMMSNANKFSKEDNRVKIVPKDVTNAILEQGKRGSIWPICE